MQHDVTFESTANGGLRPNGPIIGATRRSLRQAKADLTHWVKSLNVTIQSDNRPMSDVERANVASVTRLSEQIDTELALAEARADAEIRGVPIPDPDAEAAVRAARLAGVHIANGGAYGAGLNLSQTRGRQFADLFPAASAQMDGWTSGEFLNVVARGLHDSRLRAHSIEDIRLDSNQESIPSSGGFAVPTQLFGSWLDASLENEIVRPRCTTWPMTTATLDVPALDDLTRSSGSIAGMKLTFAGELATGTPQVAKLRMLPLRARKGMLFLEASNELLADSPNFEANISAAMVRVLSFGLDERFLFGDGSTGPLGALASPAAIAVAAEGGQTANTVTYTNLVSMFARLAPGSVARSVWVANPTTIPQLSKLTITIGTGGSHIPVMTEANGQFTILTRPLIFSEKMKPLGQQGDIALCDFSAYAVGLRREASIDKSQAVGWTQDKETYRLIIRIDGQPTLSGPITPLNGDTLSPFVVLAARP